MKHIANLIDLSKLKEPMKNNRVNVISDDTAHVVNILFRELKAIFPAFRQAWPSDEEFNRAKLNWVKAFQAVGLNRIEQIRFGVEKCRLSGRPFAPSVGEFIQWCKRSPVDIGLPEFEKAYQMSIKINQQFSEYMPDCNKAYTVIKHAINSIGSMNYREMNIDKARKMFEYAYDVSCRQFMDGELKEIAKAITERPHEHSSDKERSDDARLKALEAIRGFGIDVKEKLSN